MNSSQHIHEWLKSLPVEYRRLPDHHDDAYRPVISPVQPPPNANTFFKRKFKTVTPLKNTQPDESADKLCCCACVIS